MKESSEQSGQQIERIQTRYLGLTDSITTAFSIYSRLNLSGYQRPILRHYLAGYLCKQQNHERSYLTNRPEMEAMRRTIPFLGKWLADSLEQSTGAHDAAGAGLFQRAGQLGGEWETHILETIYDFMAGQTGFDRTAIMAEYPPESEFIRVVQDAAHKAIGTPRALQMAANSIATTYEQTLGDTPRMVRLMDQALSRIKIGVELEKFQLVAAGKASFQPYLELITALSR